MATNNTQAKPRITYIDTMKGIVIILVVITHAGAEIFDNIHPQLNDFLRQFRMPMYYFLSGLFFKTYGSFVEFLKRKVNNLIVPFFFFLLVAIIIRWSYASIVTAFVEPMAFDHTMIYSWLYKNSVAINGPLWFLLSLFWTNLMYYGVKMVSRNLWQEWALIMGLAGVGYLLSRLGYWPILWTGSSLISMPYFALGALSNRLHLLKPSRNDKWGFLAFALVSVAIYPIAERIDLRELILPAFWKLYLFPFASVLSLLWMLKNLNFKIPVITYLGRYSIIVLVTHMFISDYRFIYERALSPHGTFSPEGVLVCIILIELCIIPLFVRFLPHVTAQKPLIPINTPAPQAQANANA